MSDNDTSVLEELLVKFSRPDTFLTDDDNKKSYLERQKIMIAIQARARADIIAYTRRSNIALLERITNEPAGENCCITHHRLVDELQRLKAQQDGGEWGEQD